MKTNRVALFGVAIFCCLMMTSPTWAGDNGNGTVTIGNLIWLKDAGCLVYKTWGRAMDSAAALANGQCSLSDGSSAGQWRLPTIDELRGILSMKSVFSNIQGGFYWTSTTVNMWTESAYTVSLSGGGGGQYPVSCEFSALPVRTAQ